jgi:membrane protein DedA with SNARE-associated domain
MDVLLGFSFSEAWHHLLNPFWVMSSAEYVILGGLLLILIVQQISYKKKSKKKNAT